MWLIKTFLISSAMITSFHLIAAIDLAQIPKSTLAEHKHRIKGYTRLVSPSLESIMKGVSKRSVAKDLRIWDVRQTLHDVSGHSNFGSQRVGLARVSAALANVLAWP